MPTLYSITLRNLLAAGAVMYSVDTDARNDQDVERNITATWTQIANIPAASMCSVLQENVHANHADQHRLFHSNAAFYSVHIEAATLVAEEIEFLGGKAILENIFARRDLDFNKTPTLCLESPMSPITFFGDSDFGSFILGC